MNILIVDDAQHATILAALRIYQQALNYNGGHPPADVADIATNGGAHAFVTDLAIDSLCEGINGGECSVAVTREADYAGAAQADDSVSFTAEVARLKLPDSCAFEALAALISAARRIEAFETGDSPPPDVAAAAADAGESVEEYLCGLRRGHVFNTPETERDRCYCTFCGKDGDA